MEMILSSMETYDDLMTWFNINGWLVILPMLFKLANNDYKFTFCFCFVDYYIESLLLLFVEVDYKTGASFYIIECGIDYGVSYYFIDVGLFFKNKFCNFKNGFCYYYYCFCYYCGYYLIGC